MPLTANRQFKAAPRTVLSAQGMSHRTPEDREVLDGTLGLWWVGAGHRHPKIAQTMKRQTDRLDFASSFQAGHPGAFELAQRTAGLAPPGLDRVFHVNSGCEACDTAMKIALAFWQARGEGQQKPFVGRERVFHGVGFAGSSVGGMTSNRRAFGGAMLRADALRSTRDAPTQALVRGQPATGADMADELENRIIALHDARQVAAVIVGPVAGSTGLCGGVGHDRRSARRRPAGTRASAGTAPRGGRAFSARCAGRPQRAQPRTGSGYRARTPARLARSPRGPGTGGGVRARTALTRTPGDTLVLAPPFISTHADIDRRVDLLRSAIQDSFSTLRDST